MERGNSLFPRLRGKELHVGAVVLEQILYQHGRASRVAQHIEIGLPVVCRRHGAIAPQAPTDCEVAKSPSEALARWRARTGNIDGEAASVLPLTVTAGGVDVDADIDAVILAELLADAIDITAVPFR